MKNELLALAGSSSLAIDTMPRSCGVGLNSGCRFLHEGLLLLVERLAPRRHVPALNHEALDDAVERGPVVHAR